MFLIEGLFKWKKSLQQKMFGPSRYACNYADRSRKLQKADWVVTSWQIEEERIGKPPLELSRIVKNLTSTSCRGGANLKISIFLLNMFVFMLIELENHKNLQTGCSWSLQIEEEGKLSSIDIYGQLLSDDPQSF